MAEAARKSMIFRERQGALPNSLILLWTTAGWLSSFALMGNSSVALNTIGVILCTHTMVLAAYLIHEAAHGTLFAKPLANRVIGEWLSFMAGASYASFGRIQHMHIRHHRDRADVACFNFKALMERHPFVRRVLEVLEWAYIPATEMVMHYQIILRPFLEPSQRSHLPRVLFMLALRGALFTLLAMWSIKALLLYVLAYGLLLHVLNFFDAFHHTFEQYFAEADEAVPMNGRDRVYEQANTFSNLISVRWPVLNLLTVNFGYHNAHHERMAVPWYRLPELHASLYGDHLQAVMPLGELLVTWHRNRVRRVASDDYGVPGKGEGRADHFVGAHGVSFLTVV